MRGRPAAVGIAALALLVALAFGVLGAVCGQRALDAVPVGSPQGAPRCVSYVNPFLPGVVAGAALALAAAWLGRRDTLLWVGGTLAVATLPIFSLGLVGTAVGLLLVAAGLAQRAPEARGPGPMLSLAATGFVMTAGVFALGFRDVDGLVLAGASIIALGLALAERPIPLVLVGAVAVLWGAFRWQQEALGDVLLASFLLMAGVAGVTSLAKRETTGRVG